MNILAYNAITLRHIGYRKGYFFAAIYKCRITPLLFSNDKPCYSLCCAWSYYNLVNFRRICRNTNDIFVRCSDIASKSSVSNFSKLYRIGNSSSGTITPLLFSVSNIKNILLRHSSIIFSYSYNKFYYINLIYPNGNIILPLGTTSTYSKTFCLEGNREKPIICGRT